MPFQCTVKPATFLSDVERVYDVVAIIDKGKLATTSSVEELRQRHAYSVFELKFEEDAVPLIARLESVPWPTKMEKVTVNDTPTLRLQAKDIDKTKLELPKMVAESGLTLLCYELTLPSLEDISIELVKGEGKK